MKKRVLFTSTNLPKIAHELLENSCDIVVVNQEDVDRIYREASNADAIILTDLTFKINDEFFDKIGSRLKIIANYGAGHDHIDAAAARRRGVGVSTTPRILAVSVAEMAVGLTLAASRRFREARLKIERDQWNKFDPQWLLGQDIYDSTFGIVGLGLIGIEVARRVKAFAPKRLIYSDVREQASGKEIGAEFVHLDTLLRESDFITLCCTLNETTRKLINEETIEKMKPNAIIVNIARGGLIDHEALYKALKAGKIAGAGLDVVVPEPLPPNHPLLQLDNCYITPHIASGSFRTRNAMAELAARNILAALNGEPLITPL